MKNNIEKLIAVKRYYDLGKYGVDIFDSHGYLKWIPFGYLTYNGEKCFYQVYEYYNEHSPHPMVQIRKCQGYKNMVFRRIKKVAEIDIGIIPLIIVVILMIVVFIIGLKV